MKKYVQVLIIMCCAVELYADITAKSLLNNYKEFQSSIAQKRIESTTISEFFSDSTVNKSRLRAIHESFITDGSRAKFKTMSWVDINSLEDIGSLKNLDESPENEKTVIWDGKTYFEHRPRKNFVTEFAFASKDIERNQKHLAVGYSGGPLEGICSGDIKSIVDIFDSAKEIDFEKDIVPVNGQDAECYSLSMENENGKWKVWLCPEYDYNICRMETQKKEGQPAYGSKLPMKSPSGNMVGLSFELFDVKFEKIDGKWIAKEGRYIIEWTYLDGRKDKDIIYHKRTHIDLTPNFDDSVFTPVIKEGTRVHLDGPDDDVIPYFWKGGKDRTRCRQLKRHIAVLKTFWDISSNLRERRLYSIISDNWPELRKTLDTTTFI